MGQMPLAICFRASSMATMIAWTTEGWSRDVTTDIAGEVRRSCAETNERSESLLALLETDRGSGIFHLPMLRFRGGPPVSPITPPGPVHSR